jgi:subtilisin family serine protease
MRWSNIYSYLAIALAAICLSHQSLAEVIPNQVVVKFKPGVIALPKGLSVASVKAASISAASVKALNAKYQAVKVKQLFKNALNIRPDWQYLENYYVITYAATDDARQAAKEYGYDANIERAETNSYVRAFDVTPNDPYFLGGQQWALAQIHAPAGWAKTTGTSEAIIAVLDTGIKINHEDFAGKVDLTEDPAKITYNYISPGSQPADDFGHGTLVSGIIGAVTNNNKGVAGVDWNVKILPIKVLDSSGSGSIADVSDALAALAALKTTGKNIVAVNMSLGQYNSLLISPNRYTEEDPDLLKENCQQAYDSGIVLVAAAGNGGVDWNTYPAYYPTVLAVAATDQNDKRSIWTGPDPETHQTQASNYGRKGVLGQADNLWVDIAAPGTDIFSTNVNGGYSGGEDGTSFSAPYVSGLVGLVKAVNPAMAPAQVMSQIELFSDNIDALNPGFEGKIGAGRINAYRALQGLTSVLSSPASQEYVRGTKAITGTASGWNFASYEVDSLINGSVEAIIATSKTAVDNSQLASWNTTASRYGRHTIRLLVTAADKTSAEADVSVTVDNIAPTAEISSPATGATIAGQVTIIGRATDDYLDRYLLEYGSGASPTNYQTLATVYTSTTGALATWETTGLSGLYALRLTAYDKAGNTSTEAIKVSILTEVPTKSVQPIDSLPLTFAMPNPFIRSGTNEVSFNYSLTGNFNTAIYLFDLNGNLVWQKTYSAGENGGKAGPNNPAWNGADLYGVRVANGVYLYQITGDKRVIARGKIIVLN